MYKPYHVSLLFVTSVNKYPYYYCYKSKNSLSHGKESSPGLRSRRRRPHRAGFRGSAVVSAGPNGRGELLFCLRSRPRFATCVRLVPAASLLSRERVFCTRCACGGRGQRNATHRPIGGGSGSASEDWLARVRASPAEIYSLGIERLYAVRLSACEPQSARAAVVTPVTERTRNLDRPFSLSCLSRALERTPTPPPRRSP